MKPAGQRAVIIFIDNSAMSINGDFLPNRLTAQINTIERYASYLFSENTSANSNPDGMHGNSNINNYNSYGFDFENIYENREPSDLYSNDSLIAVGTIGSEEFGIRTSFTSNYLRLEKTLSTITSGGTPLLDRAIKLGFMALKHAPLSAQLKMMIFINSSELSIFENSMDDKKVTELNKKILENKKITVNFIVIGENNSLNLQRLPNDQNFPISIPQSIPNNNSQNIQNLTIMQPTPLLQNQQFYMQNQSDVANSKRGSKAKKNTNSTANSGSSILQRIIKKAKNATIMIVSKCNTILSDVIMATEMGLQIPNGLQIIQGAPPSGSRKHNTNISNTNIRSTSSNSSGIIYEPENCFDIGYGYDPRIGIGIQMIENELNQPHIQSTISLPSATMQSPQSVKKEKKSQKIKTIIFQNSNMLDKKVVPINIQPPPLSEQKQVKKTRGRKPKYSVSCPVNQIIPNVSEKNLSFQQVMPINYNNGIETCSFVNLNNPTSENKESNSEKLPLTTSSAISISSNSQAFPSTIQAPIIQNFQSIPIPTTTRKKSSKARNTKITQEDKTDQIEKTEEIKLTSDPPARPRKQKKQKNIEEKNISQNIF